MKRIPPYFQNFDDTHCLQCALRSALEHFNPKKKWTWKQLDKFSGKQKHGTWHMTFLANLGASGYKVVCIEDFKLDEFVADGEAYLRRKFKGEALAYCLRTINLKHEMAASEKLLAAQKKGLAELHYRSHTAADLRNFLKKGYLVIHWVNSSALHEQKGYTGHFVLAYQLADANTVVIHDNGGITTQAKQPFGMPCWRMAISRLLKAGTTKKQTGGFYAIKPARMAA